MAQSGCCFGHATGVRRGLAPSAHSQGTSPRATDGADLSTFARCPCATSTRRLQTCWHHSSSLRTWHAETLARTGPTAARQAYATLRAILNTAVDDDAIHRNPCRITGAGQPSSPERPLLDLETVEALAAAMPTHLQTLCLVTFWAHLRIGEVVALQRRDVDILRGKIRIERQHVELRTGPLETEPKAASRRTVHRTAEASGSRRSGDGPAAYVTPAPASLRAPARRHFDFFPGAHAGLDSR